MWAIPTGASWLLKKKKNQVKSPSPESRVPETSSNPPIGSERESGRDRSQVQQLLTCTKAPSPATTPFDSCTVGVSEPTKFIIRIPPIAVAKLLQYSGFIVEHGDGFSPYKMICSDSKW